MHEVLTRARWLRVLLLYGAVAGLACSTCHYSSTTPGDVAWYGTTAKGPPGTVGSSGLSTEPILHFEIRYKGVAVDPLAWLGQPRQNPEE